MIKKKTLGFTSIQIFLIVSYAICWLSISTSFFDLNYLFIETFLTDEILNSNNVINFLRQFLNVVIFPILLIIFLKNIKKINIRNEILFISALLYFLLQIPGLFFTTNSFTNFVYIMSAFNILLIFVLANIFYDKKKYIIFVIISLVMLIVISLLNYKPIVVFFTEESGSTLYTFFGRNEFFGKDSPRSTGSSRTFLLIFIISMIVFHKFFKKYDYLKIFFYNIISPLVLLFQSRTTIVLMIVFIVLNFIFEKKFTLKNFIKHLFFYIVFPIFLLYSTLFLKQLATSQEKLIIGQGAFSTFKSLNNNFQRPIDPDTYSSGRFNDWKLITKKIDSSIFYGYGAQGDRHLINQSASNGLLYAISSSGVLGLFFYLFFSFYCLTKVFKNLILDINLNFNQRYFSALVIFLMLLRSILESSYAVFSLDFIIIVTFINFLDKLNTKENNDY